MVNSLNKLYLPGMRPGFTLLLPGMIPGLLKKIPLHLCITLRNRIFDNLCHVLNFENFPFLKLKLKFDTINVVYLEYRYGLQVQINILKFSGGSEAVARDHGMYDPEALVLVPEI